MVEMEIIFKRLVLRLATKILRIVPVSLPPHRPALQTQLLTEAWDLLPTNVLVPHIPPQAHCASLSPLITPR